MNSASEQSHTFLQKQAIHSQWQSDYLTPEMDKFYDRAFADIVHRSHITPDSSVLDAGCGDCYHTVRLARSGAKITAVDFSEAALAAAYSTIAQAGIQNQVSLQRADLTALAFPDASFDFVVSWGVLMYIPLLEMALTELARVLKPGGVLVLSEYNMHSPDVAIRERAIHLVKKMLGKSNATMQLTSRGIEVWEGNEAGGLMVRKTNMEFLSNYLAMLGVKEFARTAGQLSEVYTNLPTKALKRVAYAMNNFYYESGWSPKLACGNILYSRKGM
jgi:ubiquinone/menaquinone biosynthesis C-methylase UbiE